MPRTPEQFKQIQDRRRAKIKAAGLKQFALQGFDRVSVDDVMKSCRCAHGLFYHYFPSLDVILDEILKARPSVKGATIPLDEAKKAGGLDGLQILIEYFQATIEKSKNDPIYYTLISLNYGDQRKLDRKKYDPLLNLRDPMTKMVEEGQEKGDIIGGEPADIAKMLVLALYGAFYEKAMHANHPDQAVIPNLMTLIDMLRKR